MIHQLSQAAKPWYLFNGENRHYHNWDHANWVALTCYEITEHMASDELILAAWWHDAVHVPHAGSDANERCSAAALLQAGRGCSKEDFVVVDKAAQLILYTCVEIHLNERRIVGDLAVLLDADLSSLADPCDKFLETQQNIIKEMNGTWPESQPESEAFLKNFLECREFIYHTDYGREHWEAAARANIERYLKS